MNDCLFNLGLRRRAWVGILLAQLLACFISAPIVAAQALADAQARESRDKGQDKPHEVVASAIDAAVLRSDEGSTQEQKRTRHRGRSARGGDSARAKGSSAGCALGCTPLTPTLSPEDGGEGVRPAADKREGVKPAAAFSARGAHAERSGFIDRDFATFDGWDGLAPLPGHRIEARVIRLAAARPMPAVAPTGPPMG